MDLAIGVHKTTRTVAGQQKAVDELRPKSRFNKKIADLDD